MALSGAVVLAVLGGAALHAGWNALVKSSQDKALDTALVQALGALLALPALLVLGLPRPQSWPFIGVSMLVHTGYYAALAGAYRHGELGTTYPIMRGFAPLLVALASGRLIGEVPTATAWIGVLGISLGVTLVGLAHPGRALHPRKALLYAFANAGIIALYTLVDGLGARQAGDALRYVLLLFVLNGGPYPLLVAWHRGRAGWPTIRRYAGRRWPLAALGGAASIGSYAIALWAMTRAPVASVAALRETSVLFAAVLGTLALKESLGWQRGLGTLVVLLGVIALRLG